MVAPVIVLNLFFVPAVALWIHNKRRNADLEPSLKMLLEYAILASCNVPLTKVGVFLFKRLLGWEISIDSGYYTILSIAAAAVLPAIVDRLRQVYRDRKQLLQAGKKLLTRKTMKYKQKLLTLLLLIALIVIACMIRGPLEIYAGNMKDFLFTLEDFFFVFLLRALVSTMVLGGLIALLPDMPFYAMSVLLFWLGVTMWVQDLFLNKKLAEINGGPMDWASLGELPRINAVIWLILLGFAVFLCIKYYSSWHALTRFVAGALCLIQLVACVSLFVTMPPKEVPEQFISGAEQMKLASDENVIVLLFDELPIEDVRRMEQQYPEVAGILKDFTCYDNACCNYFSTYPSVTHFLTGYELEFGTTTEKWFQQAWNSERCNRFYQNLQEEGFTNRIYCNSVDYVFGSIENLMGKFENICPITMKTDTSALQSKLLKLSAYRYTPYVCKPMFEVLTSEFSDVVVLENVPASTLTNSGFYQRLKNERLSVDFQMEKLFVYEHLFGAHGPWTTDVQANNVETGTTQIETIRGCFTIIEEYINQLKALGLYERATIIVMSDHGVYYRPEALSPIFYVKRPGEVHDQSPVNTAPIEYGDFQATIMELVNKNDDCFGTSVFDWKPGEERRRELWRPLIDETKPPVQGSGYNFHSGWVYYKDAQELREHVERGTPDEIKPANRWIE